MCCGTETNHEISYGAVFDKSTAISRAIAQSSSTASVASSNSIQCTNVALPRCTALPIALLGVVKSGHAYWAVDLTLQSPAVVVRNRERLDCRCVIADAVAMGVLYPKGLPIGVLGIVVNPSSGEIERTVPGTIPSIPVEDHLRIHCPSGTMYLEFTSGSTGQPKAVAVPHSCGISLCRNSAAIFKCVVRRWLRCWGLDSWHRSN
ncbi:non-ribosomal peptide synthetase, putative, partial [Bodo saltans]